MASQPRSPPKYARIASPEYPVVSVCPPWTVEVLSASSSSERIQSPSSRSATVGAVLPAGQELFRMIRKGRLEWRAEVAPALLLHLDDEQPPAAPQDQVELVAADAGVRGDEPVAAEPVVEKGAALAAIHAASTA